MSGGRAAAVLLALCLGLAAALGGVGLRVPAARAFAYEKLLANPAQEARAEKIFKSLRCLVCQNESIADSDADLAADLRQIVRQLVAKGDTDAQVRQYLVARYGEWILLKPRFEWRTLLLWLGPAGFLLLASLGVFVYFRHLRPGAAGDEARPLSAEEERRLETLLGEGESR